MRSIARCVFALVAVPCSAFAAYAVAQDDMLHDVEPEAAMSSVADDYGKGCCETACCQSGTTYGEIQYLSLKTYSDVGIFTGTDAESGFRAIAGYEACSGAGVRVRYLDYDGVNDVDLLGPFGIEVRSLDIEATHSFGLCGIDGVLSAGYRHSEYDVAFGLLGGGALDFSGDGLTFGLQFDWEVYNNLSLYAWGQQSFVFGETEFLGDKVGRLSEAQIGAQYSTCLAGYPTFVRAGAEAQYHDNFITVSSTGLWGWFLSAGVGY
jgi:hypothetical protein